MTTLSSFIGSGFKVPSKIQVTSEDVVTVGTDDVTPTDITDVDLTSALQNVADITSVSSGEWNNLLSIDAKGGIQSTGTNGHHICSVTVDAAEGVGDSLRLQIVIDGTVVGDAHVIGDGADDRWARFILFKIGHSTSTFSGVVYFNSSFVIRAVRKGEFADATSGITFKTLNYQEF